MSNKSRLILPGGENGNGEEIPDPLAPVTRATLDAAMQAIAEDLADLKVRYRVGRLRFEALLKMISYAPEMAFQMVPGRPVALPEGGKTVRPLVPKLDMKSFYGYITDYAAEFTPALQSVISGTQTVRSRVDRAKHWNDQHPTLPMTAEDLKFHDFTDKVRLSDQEAEAVLQLPHSDYFDAEWKQRIEENHTAFPA